MSKYAVFAQYILGYSGLKIRDIMDRFGSFEGLFLSDNQAYINSGLFSKGELDRLKSKGRYMSLSEKTVRFCEQNGIMIVSYESSQYPFRLKNISDPPAVLYVKGNLPSFDDEAAIAVVGTREPTDYGKRASFSLSARLSKAGALIVSGAMRGIDCYANGGALAAGARTVAVLGNGFGADSFGCSNELLERILSSGALITEYRPKTQARKWTFPKRNRIIAGLCVGTVVIDAPERSGALITARLAAEEGRDVFAVPGSPATKECVGSNLLIKDGAISVLKAEDVLNEYLDSFPSKISIGDAYENNREFSVLVKEKFCEFEEMVLNSKRPRSAAKKISERKEKTAKILPIKDIKLSENAAKVYSALKNGPKYTDEIKYETQMDLAGLLSAVCELEISGLIESLPGGRFKRV